MAQFHTVAFQKRMTTSGPGRLAKNTIVLATDPVNMADLMDVSTFVWSASDNWSDLGGVNGGVNMTHGMAEQEYSNDHSDGPYRTEITGHTYTIAASLVEVGNIEIFREAFLSAGTTAVVAVTKERILGLSAVRQVPRKSLAIAHVDEGTKLRAYYFRDVGLQAGDTSLNLAPNTEHALPITFRAFPNLTNAYANKEFGFIMEADGFGGVASP